MKRSIVIFCVLNSLLISSCFAQKEGNNWLLGFNTGWPKLIMNFNNGYSEVNSVNRSLNFRTTNASISDSLGNLLFYTNGIAVMNKNHQLMVNGNNLSPGFWTTQFAGNGQIIEQGALILPRPGSKSDYVLFHQTFELDANSYAFSPQLLLSTIDMTLSAGTGQVVQKNISVINDSLRLGGLTAVKHANGRDWWILTKQFSKELYYKILLTPNGIASIDTQSVAGAFAIFDGQAKFSPDGNWYATYSNLQGLRLYNFDRCTGTLFNFTYISPNDSIFVGGGLAFGSESKTLFINNTFRLIQYDLQAPNIALSEKIIADAEVFHSPFPPWISQFSYTSNGIDNKIYICTFDNTSSLHVIHNPNGIGKQCGFHPHSQYIGGLHMEGLPVFSGFQLGPVVGSSCDTLPDNNQNRIDINKVFQCTTLNLLPPNSHTSQTIKDQIQVRNFRKLKDEEVNFRDKLQFHKMLLKNDFNPGQQY